MSYIKIQKIKKELVEKPENGYVYLGYDDSTVGGDSTVFWIMDDTGEVRYLLSSYITSPAITSFSPIAQCYNNDTLTINGSNFILNTTTVTFNGIPSSHVNVISPNQLTVIVPTNDSVIGEIDVVVSTEQYGSSQPVKYVILYRSLEPVITNSPSSARIGDTILIKGSNFEIDNTIAYLNNYSGITTVIDPYNLNVVVPNIYTGVAQLLVQNGYGQSNIIDITINESLNTTFTGFYPTTGYVDDIIHISGTNFKTAQINVSFGPTQASEINVVSPTHIMAKISNGTPFGITRIRVDKIYLGDFNVLGSTASLLPVISDISPSTASIGSIVIITCSNLSGDNLVALFGDAECALSPYDTNMWSTVINSNVSPGMNSVQILNTYGASNKYVYEISHPTLGPTITNFIPSSEYVGTSIDIFGTNFKTANAVYFGDVIANNSYISPTQIRVQVPIGVQMGEVNIKVVNSSGTYIKNEFTVLSSTLSPIIESISPVFGKYLDNIDIYGENLSNCIVSFGTTYSNSISGITTVIDSTHLKVKVPLGVVSNGEDKNVNIYAKNTIGNTYYTPFNVFSTTELLPSIYSFTPNYGVTGTTISILGDGFSKYWTDSYISIITGGTTKYILMNSQKYIDANTITANIPYSFDYVGNSSIKVITPSGEAQKYPFNLMLTTTTTTLQPNI